MTIWKRWVRSDNIFMITRMNFWFTLAWKNFGKILQGSWLALQNKFWSTLWFISLFFHSENKYENKKAAYSVSASVNLLPKSLLHSCSLQILASSKWADVYSIARFSRESPLKLDLFLSLIIFMSLQDLSPAPIPRRFEVTLQAPNPRMQV